MAQITTDIHGDVESQNLMLDETVSYAVKHPEPQSDNYFRATVLHRLGHLSSKRHGEPVRHLGLEPEASNPGGLRCSLLPSFSHFGSLPRCCRGGGGHLRHEPLTTHILSVCLRSFCYHILLTSSQLLILESFIVTYNRFSLRIPCYRQQGS